MSTSVLKFYENGKEYTVSLTLDFPLENVVCCCCLKLEGFTKFSSNTHGKQRQSSTKLEKKPNVPFTNLNNCGTSVLVIFLTFFSIYIHLGDEKKRDSFVLPCLFYFKHGLTFHWSKSLKRSE